uniref:Uncharacterized protein n=1 Tax=Tetranychus urticae TaxID=32264 RepID=T1KU34_TETUR
MGKLSCIPIEFPEEIKARVDLMASEDHKPGYYFLFTKNVLFYHDEWEETFIRSGQCISSKGVNKWIVECTLINQGEVIKSYGGGPSCGVASDVCAYRLHQRLHWARPDYFMVCNVSGMLEKPPYGLSSIPGKFPKYLIGYPNVRVTSTCAQRKAKSYDLVEEANSWMRLLYNLHRRYYKLAKIGVCGEKYLDVVFNRAIRGVSPVAEPTYGPERSGVDLDHDIIRGLCANLRNFCDGRYFKSGGDERKAYTDIMYKLASEDEKFLELFVKIDVNYNCRRCVKGPHNNIYYLPMIIVDANNSFQYLLKRVDVLVKLQNLTCTNKTSYGICGGEMRSIFRCKILNLPRLLCFGMTTEVCKLVLVSELSLSSPLERATYYRLSSSNRFKCYKNSEGVLYGDKYRLPLPTDVFAGWHTYPTVKTTEEDHMYLSEVRLDQVAENVPEVELSMFFQPPQINNKMKWISNIGNVTKPEIIVYNQSDGSHSVGVNTLDLLSSAVANIEDHERKVLYIRDKTHCGIIGLSHERYFREVKQGCKMYLPDWKFNMKILCNPKMYFFYKLPLYSSNYTLLSDNLIVTNNLIMDDQTRILDISDVSDVYSRVTLGISAVNRDSILKAGGYISYKDLSTPVYDDLGLKRCVNCHSFKHLASSCVNVKRCEVCAESHPRECPFRNWLGQRNCASCDGMLSIGHHTYSTSCPTLQFRVRKLVKEIRLNYEWIVIPEDPRFY